MYSGGSGLFLLLSLFCCPSIIPIQPPPFLHTTTISDASVPLLPTVLVLTLSSCPECHCNVGCLWKPPGQLWGWGDGERVTTQLHQGRCLQHCPVCCLGPFKEVSNLIFDSSRLIAGAVALDAAMISGSVGEAHACTSYLSDQTVS